MANTFELIKKHNKPVLFASSQMSELGYSTYGQLKSIGEKMTKDLNGIIVRFWNVYGYEKDEEKSHVITDFIKMAKYDGVINFSNILFRIPSTTCNRIICFTNVR